MKNKTLTLTKLLLFVLSILYLITLYSKTETMLHQTTSFTKFSENQLLIIKGISSLVSGLFFFVVAAVEYLFLRFLFKKLTKKQINDRFKLSFFSNYAFKLFVLTTTTLLFHSVSKFLISLVILGILLILNFILFRKKHDGFTNAYLLLSSFILAFL